MKIARGDLATSEGRLAIEAFFRRFMPQDLRARPRCCGADGSQILRRLRQGCVSIINHASVAASGNRGWRAGAIHCASARTFMSTAGPPGASSIWLDRELAIGTMRLKVIKRIMRCAATNVDPQTGIRDLQIPATLMRNLDHADCGIYAKVITPGEIAPGADVLVLDKPERVTRDQVTVLSQLTARA